MSSHQLNTYLIGRFEMLRSAVVQHRGCIFSSDHVVLHSGISEYLDAVSARLTHPRGTNTEQMVVMGLSELSRRK